MPDPKIKTTKKPPKKVPPKIKKMPKALRKGQSISIGERLGSRNNKKISPAMKLKIAEVKKANLIKTNKLLKKQKRKKVKAAPTKDTKMIKRNKK